MVNNFNSPQEYDAVLGGANQPLDRAVVLGGIEGIKQQLKSGSIGYRTAALSKTLQYGEAGLDLLIEALQDTSLVIQKAAYQLLKKRTESKVQEVLQNYNFFPLFQCLHMWQVGQYAIKFLALDTIKNIIVSDCHEAIQIHDLKTGNLLLTLENSSYAQKQAVNFEEEIVISIFRDGKIRLWDLKTGNSLHDLENYAKKVFIIPLTISANCQMIAGFNNKNSNLEIWNLKTGKLQYSLGELDYFRCPVAIGFDNQMIVAGYKIINVWDIDTTTLLNTLNNYGEPIYSLKISPNGETIIGGAGSGNIYIWNWYSEKPTQILKQHSNVVNCLEISSNGQTLISSSLDITIKIWDLNTGELKHTFEWGSSVASLAISPDGETLFSGSRYGAITVWGIADSSLNQ